MPRRKQISSIDLPKQDHGRPVPEFYNVDNPSLSGDDINFRSNGPDDRIQDIINVRRNGPDDRIQDIINVIRNGPDDRIQEPWKRFPLLDPRFNGPDDRIQDIINVRRNGPDDRIQEPWKRDILNRRSSEPTVIARLIGGRKVKVTRLGRYGEPLQEPSPAIDYTTPSQSPTIDYTTPSQSPTIDQTTPSQSQTREGNLGNLEYVEVDNGKRKGDISPANMSVELLKALETGNEQMVRRLLKKGVDANAQGGHYGNALQIASIEGHHEAVQLLLENGAEINAQGGHYGNALQAASSRGHDQLVRLLLEKGAEINAEGGYYGSALQAASFGGRLKTVQLLLNKGADVNAQGGHCGNALQAASHWGHCEVIRLLLEKGADINAQGGHYGNALQAASFKGQRSAVQLLLEKGADIDAQGVHHGNALEAASVGGHHEVVRLLLEKGAEINAHKSRYGNALQAASSRGHDQLVRLLLEKGAEINAKGGYFGSALKAASRRGHIESVWLLLKKGADVNAEGGYYGSALQAASSRGYDRVCRLLLEKGADVNAEGGYYGSALQAASSGGYYKVCRLLLEKGADVNAEGGYGSALQVASSGGYDRVCRLLLEKGADVNAGGGYYGSALQAATSEGRENVVRLLREKGAETNHSTRKEQTQGLYATDTYMGGAGIEADNKISDDASDTILTSFFSKGELSNSSQTSVPGIINVSFSLITDLLMNDTCLHNVFRQALSSKHLDLSKFQSRLAHLLKSYHIRLVDQASSTVESRAAALFQKRSHRRSIANAMIREISGRPDRLLDRRLEQDQSKEDLDRVKAKRVEDFLRDQIRGNDMVTRLQKTVNEEGPPDFEDDQDSMTEASEQSEIEYEDAHEYVHIDAAKAFLLAGDPFSRFKEELEDSLFPLRNRKMWNKYNILWDRGEAVQFLLPDESPSQTWPDRIKLRLEARSPIPVIWKPFREPKTAIRPGFIRIRWIQSDVHVDVPSRYARQYRMACTTKECADDGGTLPFHAGDLTSTEASAMPSFWISLRLKSLFGRNSQNPEATQKQVSSVLPEGKPSEPNYLHWCVESKDNDLQMHPICTEEKEGFNFIRELKRSYRLIRGWKWYLSLTTCGAIKLTKFVRLDEGGYDHENEVAAIPDEGVLPNLLFEKDWRYHLTTPEKVHIMRVEKHLKRYYHQPKCANQINNLISRIPQKVGKLTGRTPGYGFRAIQGWSVYKCFVMLSILLTPTTALAIISLVKHPWGWSDALSPMLLAVALFTAIVVIPDLYSEKRKMKTE
ncbi:MAG: hypothetical protein M1824_005969 [Vezdaea acicularis]|nr:MAG: hypothetical protein M1824_005969 [Vezdaea acicularis]